MDYCSGPMFERKTSGVWKSVTDKDGAHYNNYGCKDNDGMTGLKEMFPDGEANEFNFVLFSTSGIHGMHTTIEEVESDKPDEDGYKPTAVTFLIVQPRICCLRHGNCIPETKEDIDYLKKLRKTSWDVVLKIGKPEEG